MGALLAASLDITKDHLEAAKALLAASLDITKDHLEAAKALLAASLDVTRENIETFGHPSDDERWGELRNAILTRPGAAVKRILFKMPWDKLKKFAKAHHMNSKSFAKFRHGGDKNGFVREIMTHIHYSFAQTV